MYECQWQCCAPRSSADSYTYMYARARRTCELPRATERWSSKCVGGFFTLRRYTTDCYTCVSASAAAAVLLCSCAATIVFAVAAGLSFDLSCSGYHSRIPGNQVQLVCAYGTYQWPALYSHIPIRTYSSPMFCILLYVQQPAGFNTTHARGTQSEADVYRGLHLFPAITVHRSDIRLHPVPVRGARSGTGKKPLRFLRKDTLPATVAHFSGYWACYQ